MPEVLPDAAEPARRLVRTLRDPRRPLTIADAAAQSGLPLRDAERGLHALTAEYRGHLRVTDQGELLFLFPYGFTQPWRTRDALERTAARVGRALAGLGRFVVRAWVTIALLGYAALFLALIVASTLARSSESSSRRDHGPGVLGYVIFRVLADALFWTFHPWSPIAARNDPRAARRGRRREAAHASTPFYEKVNRFVFGPEAPAEDPLARERRVVQEIRARKGRIGLADVMRVTGLPREEADPMMARLMVDYDGDVAVSEEGGIFYRFPALRRTAQGEPSHVEPAWSRPQEQPPLTGNDAGANVLIAGLNGFNLVMSLFAIAGGWTLARLFDAIRGVPARLLPPPELPWALGVVPLVFSIVLFALPIARAIARPLRAKKLARERARLAVLREVLGRVERKEPVTEPPLAEAWRRATGEAPSPEALTRAVVRLGGDVEIGAEGRVRYRFADLETEARALEEERAEASEEEAKVGEVVFASDRD